MMKTKEKMTKKLAFTWSWENAKDLNICNFYFRIKKKKKKESCKYKSNQQLLLYVQYWKYRRKFLKNGGSDWGKKIYNLS